MTDEISEIENNKNTFTKDNPHPSGAYWIPQEGKWKGYKPTKGFAPPWRPFDVTRRKKRVTINEKKFLMVLSMTGKLTEAYRAVYKVSIHKDKRIENARIHATAKKVLARIKDKAPELVEAFTFEDITPDFIRKEMMKLYNDPHATIAERTRLVELMGKTLALFTDKVVSDTKIREVVEPVYTETASDMPDHMDDRKGRAEIDEKVYTA
jgi:hypothetical protein